MVSLGSVTMAILIGIYGSKCFVSLICRRAALVCNVGSQHEIALNQLRCQWTCLYVSPIISDFTSGIVIFIINILWYMTICACALCESPTPGWPDPDFVAPRHYDSTILLLTRMPNASCNAPKSKERLIGIR